MGSLCNCNMNPWKVRFKKKKIRNPVKYMKKIKAIYSLVSHTPNFTYGSIFQASKAILCFLPVFPKQVLKDARGKSHLQQLEASMTLMKQNHFTVTHKNYVTFRSFYTCLVRSEANQDIWIGKKFCSFYLNSNVSTLIYTAMTLIIDLLNLGSSDYRYCKYSIIKWWQLM